MSGQKVAEALEECCRCVTEELAEGSMEEAEREFTACNEALSEELVVLLRDAAEMKWPFVPEKWQYKNALTSEDKVNLKDLISGNLPHLLAYLKAAILAGRPLWASSAIFLVDRFLYWTDDSRQLLRITRKLHRRYADTPIAPQVVIRQARVYFSTGKLQKAEYILGSLISNSGSTGCWKYQTDSDRILVQAVSVQVRGQVLQKLGLWFEAAELICASLVGFYSLPQPDKKGIGTSLGILANILVSMDDKDFKRLLASEDRHMSFFRNTQHRLLSAAESAKMAVIYSQYASLYVLTNVVVQGTCLLSYSFSAECPQSGKTAFLAQAKEAFEIGLLTKTAEDVVTSKQELHTFVKTAYALAITHKWLESPNSPVTEAIEACQAASKAYYDYCFEENADRERLCRDIMGLVQKVKSLLKVEPFVNSDPGSFIPDAYKATADTAVIFTTDDFTKVMEKFQQHHESVREASKADQSRRCHDEVDGCDEGTSTPGLCVTAFGTDTKMPKTECATESHVPVAPCGTEQGGKKKRVTPSVSSPRQHHADLPSNNDTTQTDTSDGDEQVHFGANRKGKSSSNSLGSSLGSSWGVVTSSSRSRSSNQMSNMPSFAGDINCPTECDTEDEVDCLALGLSAASMVVIKGKDVGDNVLDISHPTQHPPRIQTGKGGNRSHRIQSSELHSPSRAIDLSHIETEEDASDMQGMQSPMINVTSQGNEQRSKSSSLSSSVGSQSSWQVIPSLESQSSIDDGRSVVRGNQVLTKATNGNSPSQISSSGQRGTQSNPISESCVETVDDSPDVLNLSQGVKVPIQGNKGRTSSSSLGSSFGSLSPLPEASSAARNKEVVGDETEDDPDNPSLSPIAVGLPGSQERPLSSSLGSSFGSSSSWQKIPSLDSLSSRSGGGQTAARNVLPTNHEQEDKRPRGHLGDIRGPTKPTFPSETLETEPGQSGLQMSVGVNSAATGPNIIKSATEPKNGSSSTNPSCPEGTTCNSCFPSYLSELDALGDILTRQHYSALFSGVCHECLMKRLPTKEHPSLPENKAYGAVLLKFSKATGLWTGRETNLYIGKYLHEGAQRKAFCVQFLHQEELLGSYVGKQYHKFEAAVQDHLNDVERQMTAQYYVTEFNKRLYEKNIIAQIFFIPSEVLLILEQDTIVGCVTAEPYIMGNFGKLTNNTSTVIKETEALQYGIAFGHFTFEYSGGEEVVVDLQGWVTEKGDGLTYLTDPQIHTLKKPYHSKSNFHQRGIDLFLEAQHGPECNSICRKLCLGKLQMPKVAAETVSMPR